MKYAITGPRGRIFQILDTPTDKTVKITDAQAKTFSANENSKAGYFVIDSKFMTGEEFIEIEKSRIQAEQKAKKFAALTPEQQAIQLAYDAASIVFESLPLGKQALWEPVRAAVAVAIKSGDMAKAYQIISTLPVIYEGAEVDRAKFLSLFPSI